MSIQASSGNGHIPAFDGIRGVAVLWVLAHQLSLPLPSHGWEARLMLPAAAGWIGVQLFFVLSGFLITGILLDTREDTRQLRHFYVRRVLRIFPLYYGTLLLTLCLFRFWPGPVPEGMSWANEMRFQPWLWAFLSNWTALLSLSSPLFAHFWSLAVEEQFYLLWPLLIRRCTPPTVLKLAGALAGASLLCRWWMQRHLGDGYEAFMAIYTFTPSRFDALAMGAAAAAALRTPTIMALWQRHGRTVTLLNLLALLVATRLTRGFEQDGSRTQLLGYSLLAWCFACWMLNLAVSASSGTGSRWSGWLQWRWLRRVGEVSFGMYVFHLPLSNLGGHSLLASLGMKGPYSLGFVLGYIGVMTVLIYGLARLSFTWVESPLLSLKDRWARYAPGERAQATA